MSATQNPRQAARVLTPDLSETATPAPLGFVVRMAFNYGLAGERTLRPLSRVETLGFMVEAGRSEMDVDAALGRALLGSGAQIDGPTLMGRWGAVDVANKGRAAVQVNMSPPGVDWLDMPSEQAAFDAIAAKAREIGGRIAEEVLPVGWRRADDVEGAISTMSALGLLFEELEALDEAIELGRGVPKPAPRAPARPPSI